MRITRNINYLIPWAMAAFCMLSVRVEAEEKKPVIPPVTLHPGVWLTRGLESERSMLTKKVVGLEGELKDMQTEMERKLNAALQQLNTAYQEQSSANELRRQLKQAQQTLRLFQEELEQIENRSINQQRDHLAVQELLRNERDVMEQKMLEMEKFNKGYHTNVRNLEKQISELQSKGKMQILEYETEQKKLKEQYTKLEKELGKEKKELKIAEVKLRGYDVLKGNFDKTKKETTDKITSLQGKLKETEVQLAKYQDDSRRLKGLQGAKASVESELRKVQKQFIQAQDTIRELKVGLKTKESRSEKNILKKKIKELEDTIGRQKKEISQFNKVQQKNTSESKSIEEELSGVNEVLAELQKVLVKKEEIILQLNKDLRANESNEKKFTAEQGRLKKELEELQGKLEKQKKEISVLSKLKRSKQSRDKTSLEKISRLEKELEKITLEKNETLKKNKSNQEELSYLQKELQILNKRLSHYKIEKDQWEKQKKAYRISENEAVKFVKDLNQAQSDNTLYGDKVKTLKEDLAKEIAANRITRQELDTLREENEKLVQALELEKENKEIEEELVFKENIWVSRLDKEREKNEMAVQNLADLKEKYKIQQKEISAMIVERTQLRLDLEDYKKSFENLKSREKKRDKLKANLRAAMQVAEKEVIQSLDEEVTESNSPVTLKRSKPSNKRSPVQRNLEQNNIITGLELSLAERDKELQKLKEKNDFLEQRTLRAESNMNDLQKTLNKDASNQRVIQQLKKELKTLRANPQQTPTGSQNALESRVKDLAKQLAEEIAHRQNLARKFDTQLTEEVQQREVMSRELKNKDAELVSLRKELKKFESKPAQKNLTPETSKSKKAPPPSTKSIEKEYVSLTVSGNQKFRRGEIDESIEDFKKAIKLDPDRIVARLGLAGAYYTSQRYPEAMSLVKSVLEVESNNPKALGLHAILLYSQGDLKTAYAQVNRALAVSKNDPQLYNYLGIIAYASRNIPEAIDALNEAISLYPDHAEAHFNLAALYVTKSRPEISLAKKHYDKAIKLGSQRDMELEKLLNP